MNLRVCYDADMEWYYLEGDYPFWSDESIAEYYGITIIKYQEILFKNGGIIQAEDYNCIFRYSFHAYNALKELEPYLIMKKLIGE